MTKQSDSVWLIDFACDSFKKWLNFCIVHLLYLSNPDHNWDAVKLQQIKVEDESQSK